MRELTDILAEIEKCNNDYRTLKLSFTIEQSEILRTLSCCYMDLTFHKIEARREWLDVYNEIAGSNALKEKVADNEVKHYELIKDVMRAVSNQIDSIRSTLSSMKKNN
jgi:hypothetical protein